MSSLLPSGWEELKAFMMQDDVSAPYKMMLPVLFAVYECGYQHKIPKEWEPMVELLRVRKLPDYARIIATEEKYGRYIGRKRKGDDLAPPATQRKKPK